MRIAPNWLLSGMLFVVPLAVIAACGGKSGETGDGAGDDASSGATGLGGSAGRAQGSSGAGNRPTAGGVTGNGLGGVGTSGDGMGGNVFPPGGNGGACVPGGTQCTDCIDNDGDGLVDWRDVECSGPLDNDERSFATGIPGDNIDFCQDCFFDGNSGHDGGEDGSDDGCAYHTDCLYGRDPGGVADCFNCSVSTQCVDSCRPFTPNGCDCFGCCEVHASDGSRRTVRLTDTCTQETLDDEAACVACVQSTECVNDCGTCELCLGKTTLPPECYGTGGTGGMGGTGGYGGTGQMCSNGGAICNENMPCPPEQFCLTGCCVEQVR